MTEDDRSYERWLFGVKGQAGYRQLHAMAELKYETEWFAPARPTPESKALVRLTREVSVRRVDPFVRLLVHGWLEGLAMLAAVAACIYAVC